MNWLYTSFVKSFIDIMACCVQHLLPEIILAVTFCDVSTEASKEKRSFICYTGKVPVCMSCSAEFFFCIYTQQMKTLDERLAPAAVCG